MFLGFLGVAQFHNWRSKPRQVLYRSGIDCKLVGVTQQVQTAYIESCVVDKCIGNEGNRQANVAWFAY